MTDRWSLAREAGGVRGSRTSGRRGPGARLAALTGLIAALAVGAAGVGVTGASGAGAVSKASASEQFMARQIDFPPQLVVRGDLVEVAYDAQTGTAWDPWLEEPPKATGTLYVRDDQQSDFTAVPMRIRMPLPKAIHPEDRPLLRAVVPRSLLSGGRLFYYAVINDRAGRSVAVPAAGAASPESAWIINDAFQIRLGKHAFGHVRRPDAVVAKAGPTQVGFSTCRGVACGPQSFLVAKNRAVWMLDTFNHRVLIWAHHHPGAVARTVRLPFFPMGDFAEGPAGTLYVRWGPVSRVSARGKVLWTNRIAAGVFNLPLHTGPDGTLYCLCDVGWVPLTTPAGRPLALAVQRQRALSEPPLLSGGRQLVRVQSGNETRLAIVGQDGRVKRAWRVRSRTYSYGIEQTPAFVGGDPVIVLALRAPPHKFEYLVLRLGPTGDVRTRFALPYSDPPWSPSGNESITQIRIEPDGNLYRLGSAPGFGAAVYRFSLRPNRRPLASPGPALAPAAPAPAPVVRRQDEITGVSTAVARFSGIPSRGNRVGFAAAPVTITVFADISSPLTARLSESVLPAIVRGFVRPGRVTMVLRPVAYISQTSERGALGLDAAARRAMIWPMLSVLAHNQGPPGRDWLSDDELVEAATRLGLDPDRFVRDYQSEAVARAFFRDNALWTKAGFSSTPAIIIRGPHGVGRILGAPRPRALVTLIRAVS